MCRSSAWWHILKTPSRPSPDRDHFAGRELEAEKWKLETHNLPTVMLTALCGLIFTRVFGRTRGQRSETQPSPLGRAQRPNSLPFSSGKGKKSDAGLRCPAEGVGHTQLSGRGIPTLFSWYWGMTFLEDRSRLRSTLAGRLYFRCNRLHGREGASRRWNSAKITWGGFSSVPGRRLCARLGDGLRSKGF